MDSPPAVCPIFQLNTEACSRKMLAARVVDLTSIHRGVDRSCSFWTRLPNEAILIGDDIEITVLTIVGDTVRIRISCPRMEPPVREETLRLDNLLSINGKVEVRVVSCRPDDKRVRLGVQCTAPASPSPGKKSGNGTPQAGQSVIRPPITPQLVVTVAFAGLQPHHQSSDGSRVRPTGGSCVRPRRRSPPSSRAHVIGPKNKATAARSSAPG